MLDELRHTAEHGEDDMWFPMPTVRDGVEDVISR